MRASMLVFRRLAVSADAPAWGGLPAKVTAILLAVALLGVVRIAPAAPPRAEEQASLADVADVPALDLQAGGDAKKRYFLVGAVDLANPPAPGYALLIVLPGGEGSADFNPFIRRIYKNALSKHWLVAQAVAPKWYEQQWNQVLWPTEGLKYPAAQFTTEQFIDAIVADVRTKAKIDPKRVFVLGWSSGGPPCYAVMLRKNTSVTGAFIAMAVFKPDLLPSLENAKGKAFYLLQSPDDRVTRIEFAEAAEKTLRAAGAKVQLQRYDGGHGWRGNVRKMIGDGIQWLENQTPAAP